MMPKKWMVLTVLLVGLGVVAAGEASAEEASVDATITSATRLDSRQVQVEGTLTCNFPAAVAFAEMHLTLHQRGGGRGGRMGDGFDSVNSCGTAPTPFTLVVSGGPYHPGRATVDAFLIACDIANTCAFRQFVADVRIARP
ncbi:MAG: hypothetical protein ACRDH0_03480 [Actinomycetota bacterium]